MVTVLKKSARNKSRAFPSNFKTYFLNETDHFTSLVVGFSRTKTFNASLSGWFCHLKEAASVLIFTFFQLLVAITILKGSPFIFCVFFLEMFYSFCLSLILTFILFRNSN